MGTRCMRFINDLKNVLKNVLKNIKKNENKTITDLQERLKFECEYKEMKKLNAIWKRL